MTRDASSLTDADIARMEACSTCGAPCLPAPHGGVEYITTEQWDGVFDRLRTLISRVTTAYQRFKHGYMESDWDAYMDAMRALIAEEQRWPQR